MHVGDEQIRPSVLVVVEKLYAHRAPRCLREMCGRPVRKSLSARVFIEVIIALHVRDVEFREAVAVEVRECGLTAPTAVSQVGFQ